MGVAIPGDSVADTLRSGDNVREDSRATAAADSVLEPTNVKASPRSGHDSGDSSQCTS